MARNTKEISLIQIRSGKLSEMPKALHQSEYGLAKDANRLFIGNASNTLLKNRTIFPYQNLEILTEFSNLKDYFKYSYENNIKYANGIDDRLELKEFLPIVISCHQENPHITSAGSIKINGSNPIAIPVGDMYKFIETINNEASNTNVYATVFPGTSVITFVSTANELKIEPTDPTKSTDTGIIDAIGFIEESYDVSMPIRNVTEKLDDRLDITDFGIVGDGVTNVSKEVFSSLIEVYKNIEDPQYYRNVFFPAGKYIFDDPEEQSENENTPYFTPFPLVSNLHVHGEGIDRTIISNESNKTLLSCIDDKFYAEYGNPDYGKGGFPSNIVIEDMTFTSSNSAYLARLIGCTNVTFNRVRFSGNSSNILLLIEGKELETENPMTEKDIIFEYDASNITFNDCIFDNALTAIEITEMARNITIHNCIFNYVGTPSLKIGGDNENHGDDYDAYSSSETYSEGDRVKHDGNGWVCNTNIDVAEEWDETHWDMVDPINVKAIIVDGCHFEGSNPVSSNTSVIELGIDSQYVTTENCTFDKEIIEKTSARGTIPYKDKGIGLEYTSSTSYSIGDRCIFDHKYYIANTNVAQGSEFDATQWDEYQRRNYTDILDINTDDKKLLRFKYTQPLWEYINYLVNPYGEVALTVDGKDSEITANNGLNIVEDANGIDIRSVKDGNVTLSMDSTSNLELGKGTTDITWKQNTEYELNDVVTHNGIIYTCTFPHTSGEGFSDEYWDETDITQIIIDKVLQLNDNLISNRMGSDNIKIEPATDKVIEIKQTNESSSNYEDKIIGNNDAIPNVAFVKKYSTASLIKHITKEDVDNISETGLIEIGSFPINQYGNNIHITGVTVNIRNPFYKVVPYLNTNSASYDEGYMYYRGDVVYGESGGTKYAVILKTQVAPNNIIDTNPESIIMREIPLTYTSDIKYVDIVGISSTGEYNLTATYTPNYVNYGDNDFASINKIDIQKNNLFGYTGAEAFSRSEIYGLENKMVSFQERNYEILKPIDPEEEYAGEIYSALKLHRTGSPNDESSAERLYDEGFIYTFDEDRNYNIGSAIINNPYTVNYSNGKVCVKLYTDNGTMVTSANKNTCLLNPAGDMVIKVDFVKEEL